MTDARARLRSTMRKLAVLLGLAGVVLVAVLAWRTIDGSVGSLDGSHPSTTEPDEGIAARRVGGETRDERAGTSGQPPGELPETRVAPVGPQPLRVRHAPLGVRVVEVVDAAGRTLSGIAIELLEQGLDREVARYVVHSDATGRATLSGDREIEYALRVTGPAGFAQFVRPFRFDGDAVERVVVMGGATLLGRVEPIAILDATGTATTPGLLLVGALDPTGDAYPPAATGPARLDATGRFSITGIPPGVWDLLFVMEQRSASLGGVSRRRLQKAIALRDGERKEIVLDLAPFAPTRVDLEVRLDGAPRAGSLDLRRDFAADGDAKLETEWRRVEVGGDATASVMLPPGAWVARARLASELGEFTVTGTRFVVPARSAPQRVLVELRQARRTVVLLDPDGQPLAEVDFASDSLDAEPESEVCVTGSRGRTTLLGSPGMRRLRIRHEPLLDLESLSAWIDARCADDPDAARRAWLDLGNVELIPGDGEQLTIRLPVEWRALPRD
ncbi:MAG: hypothetical protein HZB39_01895 [Planctomycetes bacterium]|nr:hypothetical protein [Planctomycetota bacterium]